MRFRVYLYAFLSQLVCVSLSAFFYQTVGNIFKWPLQLFIIWLTPAVIYVMIRKKLFTEEQTRLTNTIKYMTSAFFKSWLFNVTISAAVLAIAFPTNDDQQVPVFLACCFWGFVILVFGMVIVSAFNLDR